MWFDHRPGVPAWPRFESRMRGGLLSLRRRGCPTWTALPEALGTAAPARQNRTWISVGSHGRRLGVHGPVFPEARSPLHRDGPGRARASLSLLRRERRPGASDLGCPKIVIVPAGARKILAPTHRRRPHGACLGLAYEVVDSGFGAPAHRRAGGPGEPGADRRLSGGDQFFPKPSDPIILLLSGSGSPGAGSASFLECSSSRLSRPRSPASRIRRRGRTPRRPVGVLSGWQPTLGPSAAPPSDPPSNP